jgi:hypothetical protein
MQADNARGSLGAPNQEAHAQRKPASFRRQLQAVKEAVRIEQVASDYGDFRLAGPDRLVGRCVSSDHEDRTPSLFIFLREQRFKCFGIGCGASGDVLDLVMLASVNLSTLPATTIRR